MAAADLGCQAVKPREKLATAMGMRAVVGRARPSSLKPESSAPVPASPSDLSWREGKGNSPDQTGFFPTGSGLNQMPVLSGADVLCHGQGGLPERHQFLPYPGRGT